MKIKKYNNNYFLFYCEGCKTVHSFNDSWQFNQDIDKPTVSPSLLVTRPNTEDYRCHSYITDGMIQYLSDCHHQLAGKTVELKDVDDWVNTDD